MNISCMLGDHEANEDYALTRNAVSLNAFSPFKEHSRHPGTRRSDHGSGARARRPTPNRDFCRVDEPESSMGPGSDPIILGCSQRGSVPVAPTSAHCKSDGVVIPHGETLMLVPSGRPG